MARDLVGRLLVNEGAFKFALPGGVGFEGMAGLGFARGLDAQQFGGDVAHGAFGLFLRLFPARAAERVERRMRLARADVFADQMRLGHGHVKFRRLIAGIGGRVFDDQTLHCGFRISDFGFCGAGRRGQIFQAEISSDAVLQMHDQVAFLQFSEINVERGAGGQRVRRFQPARTLDFVTAKNFRVGDDDQFRLVANKTTGEGAGSCLGSGDRGPASGVWRLEICGGGVFSQTQNARAKTPFRPDFLEPLAFAVVVAKYMNGVALPQPAVKLMEKFPALGLGNWQFGRALGQRTIGVERIKFRTGDCGWRIGFAGFGVFSKFNRRETATVQPGQKILPRNEKRVAGGNLPPVFLGAEGERLRLAQQKNGFARQVVEQCCQPEIFGLRTLDFGLQNPQFAARWKGDGGDFLTRNLRERIKMAERFEFVTKKFQPHGPRAGDRPHIQNAAAQGNFAFLGDLRFRLVTLFFQPFDQIQRVDFVATLQRARALLNFARRKGSLQQGGDAGHDKFYVFNFKF